MTASPTQGGRRLEDGPGQVLELIRTGEARTRTAIAERTGLSRSTVAQRLEPLFAADLIRESDDNVSTGGRPSRALQLHPRAGAFLCVDVGEDRTRVALTDLAGEVVAERVEVLRLGDGPDVLLDAITVAAREMTTEPDVPAVAGVGLGLPAPVDYDAGRVMGWSIMSGWADFDIRGHLGKSWDVPILIDNDVNLLTLAEHRLHWPDRRHLLFVKAGTGIGSGMVIDGVVNRGAQGAAGDLGHAHIAGYGDPPCRCGGLGCLESLVGGWALARDLRGDASENGPGEGDARYVAELVRRGDSRAVGLVRAGGRIMGEAVAFAASMLNPDIIVLGGLLGATGDHLVAGVREIVYQRTLPLATRSLRIEPTRLRSGAGIVGAAHLVRDHVLDPEVINRRVAEDRPILGAG